MNSERLERLEIELEQKQKSRERIKLSHDVAEVLMPWFTGLATQLQNTINELTEALSDSGIKITKEIQLGGKVKVDDPKTDKLIIGLKELNRALAAAQQVTVKNPVEVSNLNEIQIPDKIEVPYKTQRTATAKEFLPIRLTDGQKWVDPYSLGGGGSVVLDGGGGGASDSIVSISNLYADTDRDISGSIKYRGYLAGDGHWYIRKDEGGTTRYRSGTEDYQEAWNARDDGGVWFIRSEVVIDTPSYGVGVPSGSLTTEDDASLTDENGDYIIQG